MANYAEFDEISPFGPTNRSGIYGVFITTKIKTRCIYIGSSIDIFKRVMREDHVYRIAYDRFNNNSNHVYTRQFECKDFKEQEKVLIRKYKPLLNKIRYGA